MRHLADFMSVHLKATVTPPSMPGDWYQFLSHAFDVEEKKGRVGGAARGAVKEEMTHDPSGSCVKEEREHA